MSERLEAARPLWLLRRMLSVPAMLLLVAAILGPLSLPVSAQIAIALAVLLSEAEIALVRRVRSVRHFELASTASRLLLATLAVVALRGSDWPIGPLAVALLAVVITSSTVLNGRALALATAYASGALIVGSWQGDAVHRATHVAAALLAYPGVAWFVHHRTRWLIETRRVLGATVTELRRTRDALVASQSELEVWNGQLHQEVQRQTSELEERNRYLSIVSAISFTLSESMDDADSLDRAMRLVARLLQADATQLYLVSPLRGDRLDLFPATPDEADVPPVPEAVLRFVAERGVYVNSESAHEHGFNVEGMESFAAAPLSAKGRVLGAFALIGTRREWGDHDRHLLLLIGREVGVVLENARLYREALDRARREELLAEAVRLLNGRNGRERGATQALELMAEHLEAEMTALIALPEGVRKPHVVATAGNERGTLRTALERVLRSAPALVSDRWTPMVLGEGGEAPISTALAQRGLGTLVLAPVIATRGGSPANREGTRAGGFPVAGRAMVALLVVAMPSGSVWDAARTEVVDQVAAILARRMETEELVRIQQRRITELSGLAEIARLMQTGADTDRLYSGFAQILSTLMPYQSLAIARLDETGVLAEVHAYGGGGRSVTPVRVDPDDVQHPWFALRGADRWSAVDDELPSFVSASDRAGIVVPMRPKGQVLGVVSLGLGATATEDQVKIVEQGVEQLALAVDGATLYRQATERASHIQALSNLARIVASVVDLREAFDAFAEEVRWLIPFDRAVMLLLDPDGETIEPYATYPAEPATRRRAQPLYGSLAEIIVDAGGALALDRSDERYAAYDWSLVGSDIQQIAAVPVRQGLRTAAVFVLANRGDSAYSINDLDAMEEVAGLLGVTIDRLRLYEQAEHSARHDLLTGLPNYRYLQERLSEMRAGVADKERQSAVLMMDMDSLKLFNDTLGHEAGDRVIQLVGQALREAVRPQDFVARTGGDEFVVVMEDATREEAHDAATRIHRLLRDAHHEFVNAPCPVHVSVGVAVAPEDADDTGGLLHVADRAMYSAKFAGGDRTVFAADEAGTSITRVQRNRPNRLLELTLQSCTDGANNIERSAHALAERYLEPILAMLQLTDVRVMAIRTMIAANIGTRLEKPVDVVSRRLADVLVTGIRVEFDKYSPEVAPMMIALTEGIVDIAWLQIPEPQGEGLSVDEALERVLPGLQAAVPAPLVDRLVASVRGAHGERRRPAA